MHPKVLTTIVKEWQMPAFNGEGLDHKGFRTPRGERSSVEGRDVRMQWLRAAFNE